jgi:hypothetical protein
LIDEEDEIDRSPLELILAPVELESRLPAESSKVLLRVPQKALTIPATPAASAASATLK